MKASLASSSRASTCGGLSGKNTFREDLSNQHRRYRRSFVKARISCSTAGESVASSGESVSWLPWRQPPVCTRH